MAKVITGKTNSISPGGLGLLLAETIPLRTPVVVQVCEEEPLRGHVIWRDKPRPTGLGTSIPHGVAFDQMVDTDRIRQWVHHATPQSHSRVPVQFDVEFTQAGKAGHGTCLDLSKNGMFIATNHPVQPRTEILLRFKLQDHPSHTLSIPAQVVWMRGEEIEPSAIPGMGVKFLAVDPLKAALIGSVVDRLLGEASPSLDSSLPPSTMNNPTDTRHSPRIPCDILMEYHIKGERPQEGRIVKLGTAGALLTTQEPVPLEAELVLHFRLPVSNRPIRTACTVKWVDNCSVGVELALLSRQAQEEIWKFHAKESARQRKSGA